MRYRKTEEFTRLLEPHMESAIRYCRGICYRLSNEDAEDVLQNALLKAFRFHHQVSDKDKFKPWLFAIITNTYKSFTRNRYNPFAFRIDNDEDPALPQVYRQDPELSESLKLALNSLHRKEKSAILLFEVAGFTIEEIRTIQKDRTVSAVKSRLSRARGKLQKFIRSESEIKTRKGSSGSPEMKGDIDHETIQLVEDIQL